MIPHFYALQGALFLVRLLILIFLVPAIFFILTLQRAFERCAPAHRAMTPGLVWLLLIPLFNLIWNFMVVTNLAKSLEREYRSRNIPAQLESAKSIGLAWAILSCCSIIPVLGLLAALAGFVVWIVYWVKIAGLSKALLAPIAEPGSIMSNPRY